MPQAIDIIFYDGSCALCHAAVRFALHFDTKAEFQFAPLGGATHRRLFATRSDLPDSIVILTGDGRVLTRSDAILHILGRLGGIWKVAGGLARMIPRAFRDAVYEVVARLRYRVFGRSSQVCPVMPAGSRTRFLE